MPIIRIWLLIVFTILQWLPGYCQLSTSIVKTFFTNDSMLTVRLKADFQELRKNREIDKYRSATITISNDSIVVKDISVEVKPRGVFRKELCIPPQLMINFKAIKSSPLYKLGRLKLVHACSADDLSDQLIIKEFLVYKLYELMTPLSFRVRLVRLEMASMAGEAYSKPRYGFFLEDVDDMANRNDYHELPEAQRNTESMNRDANTMLALFQFMIGNTDWSVPLNRNVKILQHDGQPNATPWPVPYDFDNCGLVNAPYAMPFDELPIQSVTDRWYRGYERTNAELENALQLFREKRSAMYTIVQQCAYLSKGNKREMTAYLDGFFEIADNKSKVKDLFIHNARKQ